MKKLTGITILTVIISLFSCTPDERKFIGDYHIDHPVWFDKTTINHDEILTLNQNHEFELSGDSTNTPLHGIWKLEKSSYQKGSSGRYEPQTTISFTNNNTTITAELRGNIFYFQHPNVFRPKKYKHILYVRMNNR